RRGGIGPVSLGDAFFAVFTRRFGRHFTSSVQEWKRMICSAQSDRGGDACEAVATTQTKQRSEVITEVTRALEILLPVKQRASFIVNLRTMLMELQPPATGKTASKYPLAEGPSSNLIAT
ncbi:MAG: hypothetical protein M3N13_10515, partial [Candidatus Eremiobacteraeota bacterium]|nr:hypothetical protein [Candidatus Eremiobacteraeota bacterium]